jgi:tRNA wybutosine-synthesizing protein 3
MASPKHELVAALENFLTEKGVPESETNSLLDSSPTGWETHGDLILLPKNSLNDWASHAGPELWETVAKALGGERLARKGEIAGLERRPQVEMLLGENRRVTHREHGIDYSFDVTKSMFSAGNLAERGRMGDLDCRGQGGDGTGGSREQGGDLQSGRGDSGSGGEIVLDLYAGIGYYTLPLLVRAGAAYVHACEWSDDAVDALHQNLAANGVSDRCTVYPGDNQISLSRGGSANDSPAGRDGPAASVLGNCDRVMLGLLPSSENGWPLALSALKPEGGILHLHGNAPGGEEEAWARAVVARLVELEGDRKVTESVAGNERVISLERLVKVKWYAPHVRHCVADIKITEPL